MAKSYPQIARDFGIWQTCVSIWVSKAYIEDNQMSGTKAPEAVHVREVRKRFRVLEQENEVPSRASNYLGCGTLRRSPCP